MRKDERDELMLALDSLEPSVGVVHDFHDYSQGFAAARDEAKALIDEQFRKPKLCLGDSGALAMAVTFLERKGYEVVDQRYRGFILAVDKDGDYKDGDWVFVQPRLCGGEERIEYRPDRRLFEDAISDWIVEGDGCIRCDVLSMKQLTPTSMLIQHHIDALR